MLALKATASAEIKKKKAASGKTSDSQVAATLSCVYTCKLPSMLYERTDSPCIAIMYIVHNSFRATYVVT